MVNVRFGTVPVKFVSLVDSGALGIRASVDIAGALGLDVSLGETGNYMIGGGTRLGWTLPDIPIRIGQWSWQAPVTFFEDFQREPVMGLEGFFDRFVVTVDAARGETRLKRS